MAFGNGGRTLMGPLLTVNFVVYLIVVGLSGWSLDKYIDGEQNHHHLGGNPSTIFLLIFALLAGTTGLCSVFQGYMQARVWNSVGLASAATSAIISLGITALAFGLVCKQIIVGGHRGKRLVSANYSICFFCTLACLTVDTGRLTKVKDILKNLTTIAKFTIFRVSTKVNTRPKSKPSDYCV